MHIDFRLLLQFLAVAETEKWKINQIRNAGCKMQFHCKQGEVFSPETVDIIYIVVKKMHHLH